MASRLLWTALRSDSEEVLLSARKLSRPVLRVTPRLVMMEADLGTQCAEVGGAGFAGALGFVGGVHAELRELPSQVLIEALRTRIEPGELCWQICGEQLREPWVFRLGRGRGLAQQEHNQDHECQDLESNQDWNHFGFPSLGE